ncbi:MAG: glycosyltransferase family 1 protein [Anaerolineae bacterium]|nr:glycosyltransferase family 1 protein [Anaerolineae bacterium]
MSNQIAINGRYTQRRPTGVERYAYEIGVRLPQGSRILAPGKPLGQIAGNMWEQFVLARRLRSAEVLWSPANSGPWSVARQALVLHDASPLDHPEWFRPAFASWVRLSWRILVRSVALVITPSQFSSERLQIKLGLPKERIRVIPGGVGKPFGPVSRKKILEIREKYGLPKSYFLFVGTQEPRKNLVGLFKAWDQIRANIPQQALVLVGSAGAVFRGRGYGSMPPGVHPLGYIPEADLPAVYCAAYALVLPSLYEGFGLSVLEAMACGTPVITSNRGSLPEIAAEAAMLVDPLEPSNIAAAMSQLSADRSLCQKLSAQGLERAATFGWDNAAAKTRLSLDTL